MSQSLVFDLNEAVVQAVARLVDDAGATREPSHSDIQAAIRRVNLADADPHNDPAVRVGKQKRVRQVLYWAIDNDQAAGSAFIEALIATVRGCGGFRPSSPNFCGQDAIDTCVDAFSSEAAELMTDGVLRPRNLASLSGRQLTAALRSYVLRAQRGQADSVLVAGTNKDLIEAVAGHVLVDRYGSYPQNVDFPTLLGQAFSAVGLQAQPLRPDPGGLEGASAALEVSLYQLGCAVNRLRNRAGSGHGKPFLPELTEQEIRAATEGAGLVAGRLLDELEPEYSGQHLDS